MPRRRDPQVVAEGAPPERLRRFAVEDWPLSRPEPDWWAEREPHASWHRFLAQREWIRARHAWARTQPDETAAWQVLHGEINVNAPHSRPVRR